VQDAVYRQRRSTKDVINDALRRGLRAECAGGPPYRIETHESAIRPGIDEFWVPDPDISVCLAARESTVEFDAAFYRHERDGFVVSGARESRQSLPPASRASAIDTRRS
jgi:hypothetical protein